MNKKAAEIAQSAADRKDLPITSTPPKADEIAAGDTRGTFEQIVRGRVAIGGATSKKAKQPIIGDPKQTGLMLRMVNALEGGQVARAA